MASRAWVTGSSRGMTSSRRFEPVSGRWAGPVRPTAGTPCLPTRRTADPDGDVPASASENRLAVRGRSLSSVQCLTISTAAAACSMSPATAAGCEM